MTVRINSIEPQHQQEWLSLWRGYQAFYSVDLTEAVTQSTWSRLLDPAEPVHGALAVLDSNAVGLVHFLFHRSTWTAGNICYLQDLFVAPGSRGQGIGEQLIAHVSEQAGIAGCPEVYWLTHETNATAMKLYDRVAKRDGFVAYSKLLD